MGGKKWCFKSDGVNGVKACWNGPYRFNKFQSDYSPFRLVLVFWHSHCERALLQSQPVTVWLTNFGRPCANKVIHYKEKRSQRISEYEGRGVTIDTVIFCFLLSINDLLPMRLWLLDFNIIKSKLEVKWWTNYKTNEPSVFLRSFILLFLFLGGRARQTISIFYHGNRKPVDQYDRTNIVKKSKPSDCG